VVELAGLEPASRTRQPSVLHAYFVFYLTTWNSDKQDFVAAGLILFRGSPLDKVPSLSCWDDLPNLY
jgi:hypothetical protein